MYSPLVKSNIYAWEQQVETVTLAKNKTSVYAEPFLFPVLLVFF